MPSDSSTTEGRRNQCIGRYEVLQYLATGGMGAVYKARDTMTGKDVALKVLPPEVEAKPGMLERFQQEAIHASKLQHEHIVTLYEYGQANHVHYLAMELIDGIDLHEYVSRKGPLGPDEARVIITQAALALDYAHEQSIIHRDIKPSNFLITRNKGRLWVKLTDFGLAREADDDEYRVTRAGSTVGTVDYMAPEQARDSRATDRRSDIYSLGCTLYFMLSGRPPFPEGGLTERILQHAEREPLDICKLNPLVPHTLAAVLQRMLAKKPSNRYQTAAALHEDLERLRSGDGPRHLEVFTLLEELEESGIRKRQSGTRAIAEIGDASPTVDPNRPRPRKPDSSARRKRREEDTDEEITDHTRTLPKVLAQGRSRQILYVALPLVLLLTLFSGLLTWWLLPRMNPAAPLGGGNEVAQNDPAPEPVPEPAPEPVRGGPPIGPRSEEQSFVGPLLPAKPPDKPTGRIENVQPVKSEPPRGEHLPPRLEQTTLPVLVENLREGFLKPWSQAPAAAPTTLQVSRAGAAGRRRQFTTLAEAVAAAPQGQETVIEIHDSGPLFELPLAVENRSLVLRAAKGYRPLLAWERGRAGAPRIPTLLHVNQGSLTLENIDVVCQLPANGPAEDLTLCRVTGGDFTARGCTFSVAGRPHGTVTLIQLSGTPNQAIPDHAPRARCRVSQCYLRAADATLLDFRTPGVDLLLDDSLLVGGSRPLLSVVGQAGSVPTVLRVLRSTLVASHTVLRIRPHGATDLDPQVHWMGWDALLARCSGEPGGEMVVLADNAGGGGMQWQATNCLYAGWQIILSGREHFGSANLGPWQLRWGRGDGDRAIAETWPPRASSTPWEDAPEAYRTFASPVWFSGTAGAEVLGCNLAALPPVREGWPTLTYGRVVAAPFPMPADLTPPAIPAATDGAYHGERLNLNEVDLGEHLDRVSRQMPLGPRVVFHLTGSGERHTSPIRVAGRTLVLWFEPPADELDPLVLTFAKGKGQPKGLIEVENGSLELLGVSCKLSNNPLVPHPRHLISLRGSDLRVFGSRLIGPLGRAPKTFQGLIGFHGPGDGSAAEVKHCGIANSVLAANVCLHSIGPNVRVRVRNSVLAAARDALHLDPGPHAQPRLNAQYYLDQCTIAARRSLVGLSDTPHMVPTEPFLVQARGNAFLDPFPGTNSEVSLISFEGDAFARGLLQWQGDDNGYDKRLPHSVAAAATPDRPRQPLTAWPRLWGHSGDRDAVSFDLRTRTFDSEKLPFEALVLPATARTRRNEPLGADLVQLRLVKRLEKPKGP